LGTETLVINEVAEFEKIFRDFGKNSAPVDAREMHDQIDKKIDNLKTEGKTISPTLSPRIPSPTRFYG
jgi:hypothetical protein